MIRRPILAKTKPDQRNRAQHTERVSASTPLRQAASLGYSATAAIFVRRAEIPVVSGVDAVARSHKLTPGEIRVLQAVGHGGSIHEIAGALGVSSATVKTHLGSIFRRTGARRRSDLVRQIASYGNPL